MYSSLDRNSPIYGWDSVIYTAVEAPPSVQMTEVKCLAVALEHKECKTFNDYGERKRQVIIDSLGREQDLTTSSTVWDCVYVV